MRGNRAPRKQSAACMRGSRRPATPSPTRTDPVLPAPRRRQASCDAFAESVGAALLTPKALLGSAMPAAAAAAAAPRVPPVVAAVVPSVLSAYTAGGRLCRPAALQA
jgi:hypothetical protein